MPCLALARFASNLLCYKDALYVQLFVVTRRVKKRISQLKRPQRSTNRDKTPEKTSNSIAHLSFLFRNLECVHLLIVHEADFLEAYPGSWAYSLQRAVFWVPVVESQE